MVKIIMKCCTATNGERTTVSCQSSRNNPIWNVFPHQRRWM